MSNGVVIEGAAENTFKLWSAEKGTKITVQVAATRHGFEDGVSTTKATAAIK